MSNNGTSSIPQWITANIFENVLKEAVKDFQAINGFRVYPALKPGENYASNMLKIELDIKSKDKLEKKQTFMLKVPNNYEIMNDQWIAWGLFETESEMYHKIIPEFEKLYKLHGVEVKFGAKIYTLAIDDNHIVLEDLTRTGYRTLKRQNGLDMDHCKSVLKKMAQWHAASAVCSQLRDNFRLKRGILNENAKELLNKMFTDAMEGLLMAVKQLPQNHDYLEKISKLSKTVAEYLRKNFQEDATEFNVLNHGDCWSNNIMFKYDADNHLESTYFVDFQVPLWGSPAMDLYYFIFSSSKLELKINHFNEMIKYYHDNLVANLIILKYEKEMPTLRSIHQMLIKYGIWGILIVGSIMAGALCEPRDVANLDLLMGDSEDSAKFKENMFLNKRYLEHIQVIIPWLNSRGGLDF
ncbi:uncharacterized protein LOC142220488 [Haematobia irritans]|uniref:uncharacterized protein LOC142220488 n=1 Tax=Haematobia irritans TaxID=7368 RepID=UPI003F4F4FCE